MKRHGSSETQIAQTSCWNRVFDAKPRAFYRVRFPAPQHHCLRCCACGRRAGATRRLRRSRATGSSRPGHDMRRSNPIHWTNRGCAPPCALLKPAVSIKPFGSSDPASRGRWSDASDGEDSQLGEAAIPTTHSANRTRAARTRAARPQRIRAASVMTLNAPCAPSETHRNDRLTRSIQIRPRARCRRPLVLDRPW